MQGSAKPFGYPSQNKKRSNATHKPNASCFTFYFAPTHQRPTRTENKIFTFAVTRTTLKKAVNIFLLAFYSFGTFCLPLGDFSVLQDIPEMYRHCKATEDKDMTPLDFITDHLVNIDGLFDKHENGDEQKPHTPNQTQHHGQTQVSFIAYFAFSITQVHPIEVKPSIPSVNFLPSGYITKIFRPPIV